jgi:hypothetical protein
MLMSNINFLTGGDVAPIRNTAAGMFGDIGPLFQRADLSFFAARPSCITARP